MENLTKTMFEIIAHYQENPVDFADLYDPNVASAAKRRDSRFRRYASAAGAYEISPLAKWEKCRWQMLKKPAAPLTSHYEYYLDEQDRLLCARRVCTNYHGQLISMIYHFLGCWKDDILVYGESAQYSNVSEDKPFSRASFQGYTADELNVFFLKEGRIWAEGTCSMLKPPDRIAIRIFNDGEDDIPKSFEERRFTPVTEFSDKSFKMMSLLCPGKDMRAVIQGRLDKQKESGNTISLNGVQYSMSESFRTREDFNVDLFTDEGGRISGLDALTVLR